MKNLLWIALTLALFAAKVTAAEPTITIETGDAHEGFLDFYTGALFGSMYESNSAILYNPQGESIGELQCGKERPRLELYSVKIGGFAIESSEKCIELARIISLNNTQKISTFITLKMDVDDLRVLRSYTKNETEK